MFNYINPVFEMRKGVRTTCSVDLPSVRDRINNETITETLFTVRVEQPKEVVECSCVLNTTRTD